MRQTQTQQPRQTGSLHAESARRDSAFVMMGHHCHPCFELFYLGTGSCRFLINDRIFDLHAGDFILVPPMALQYTRYVFGECRRTVILFDGEDVPRDVLESLPGGECFLTEVGIFQLPEAYRDQAAGWLKQMMAEDKLGDALSARMRSLCFQGLLILCARACRFLRELPADIHTTDRQILQASLFISAHYMNPITAADIARAVGFSPNHLSRKFRRAAGVGLHEYLVFIRLQHAAHELVSTNDSITTIALRCGFSNSNYFKDSFKKKYGVTPRQYRKIR